MAMTEDKLQELAQKLADRLKNKAGKLQLRLVDLPERRPRDTGMDAIQREAHYRRIRYFAGAYKLQWLVDQALFDHVNLEDLPDDDLIQLHADMDRARECPEFDVSYEERGLVRNRA